jgi:hypothetical protein
VDVLQPIGSARLALKPSGGTFNVPLQGGLDGVSIQLNVKPIKIADDEKIESTLGQAKLPHLPLDENGAPAAASAAREYLEKHQLLQFMRSLLQNVVRDRPEDAYSFIADQFRNAVPSCMPNASGGIAPEASAREKDIDNARANAREALSKAILGDKDKPEIAPPPALPPGVTYSQEDEEVAKASARMALFSALLNDEAVAPRCYFSLRPSVGTWLARAPMTSPKDTAITKDVTCEALPNSRGDDNVATKAHPAVRDALHCLACQLGVDLNALSPTELEIFQAKAQDELASLVRNAVPSSSSKALDLAPLSAEELENAKSKVKDALIRIVAPPAHNEEAAELANVKDKARSALKAALFRDEDIDDVTAAKARARDALTLALMLDEPDMESTKDKARSALTAALFGDEDFTQLGTAKSKARDALVAVLMTGEPSLESVKDKARTALATALFEDQDNVSIDTAKTKARDALAAVLLSDELSLDGAKGKARAALMTALFVDEDPATVEVAKLKAREALAAALLVGDEQSDLENDAIKKPVAVAKARARDALAAALIADDTDLESAKTRARDALEAALHEDDSDLDSTKAKAREALANTFFGDLEVDEAKQRARAALEAAVRVEDNEDVEFAKAKARDALSNALFDDIEAMKIKARDALANAFLIDKELLNEDPKIDEGPLTDKAKLKARKDEMFRMNETLKEEVVKLHSSLEILMKEREFLKQHVRANR